MTVIGPRCAIVAHQMMLSSFGRRRGPRQCSIGMLDGDGERSGTGADQKAKLTTQAVGGAWTGDRRGDEKLPAALVVDHDAPLGLDDLLLAVDFDGDAGGSFFIEEAADPADIDEIVARVDAAGDHEYSIFVGSS